MAGFEIKEACPDEKVPFSGSGPGDGVRVHHRAGRHQGFQREGGNRRRAEGIRG